MKVTLWKINITRYHQWKDPPFFVEKFTISIFSSYVELPEGSEDGEDGAVLQLQSPSVNLAG